jgi:spore germination cell wall hydrolase CwlJ-like protein
MAGLRFEGLRQGRDKILKAFDRWRRAGLAAALVGLALCACQPATDRAMSQAKAPDAHLLAAEGWSDGGLIAATARLDPGVRDIARRHDPALRRADLWGRPLGWSNLDLRQVPDLGFSTQQGEGAVAINNLRPFAGLPIRPMRPFVLNADADDSARALHCMTQAIYYEAAREPVRGQQAVAQVVLNRVRHPAYPHSVCGVVYEGSARPTGCQFTFTCNGDLRWAPQPALWKQAQDVARKALAGFVDKDVGSATHYHAAYVVPYWAPTLVKMTQVGQHIFYRWTGPWGEPPAFNNRYEGRESDLSPQLLASLDPRTQGYLAGPIQGVSPERKITLAIAGEVRTYNVVDPTTATGERTRVMSVLYAPRRQPTPDEVKRINESLAAMEKGQDATATAPKPPGADN